MILLTFFAFLSGIVTILSPCILPVLPIILSGSIGGKSKPLGIVLGFIISFSIFTLLLSTLVQALNIPPDTLRVAAIVVITAFGAVMVIPPLQKRFELLASKAVSRKQGKQRSGFGGGLFVGGSLGLLWTPCVGPIMASVISLAVSQQVDGGSVIIVMAYSAGTSLPMLGIMLGGRKILNYFPKLAANTVKIQRIFGIIMIAAGLSIAIGADRQFQTMILNAFPDYGTGLTSFENSDLIQRALSNRSESEDPLSMESVPRDGSLEHLGPAPEIITKGEWFNSAPLSMEDLRGKVVLIDFWTYSCINCVRTIPYLQAWYETYAEDGFEIIGVHSPEFAFERDPSNVAAAIEEMGIKWPVVLDNDFAQWRAYNNRFWPAHYFIDAEGRIRYYHFGEGEYENSEKVIRQLLNEAGAEPDASADVQKWNGLHNETAEIYLGYRRSEGFLSENTIVENKKAEYSISSNLENGDWGLEGEWLIRGDSVQLDGSGAIELGFYSKDLFIVIEPLSGDSVIEVLIDGSSRSILKPDKSGMYKLAGFEEATERLLRIEAEGKLRFYAFTFG
ncbi:MAG: cytochrome c biogenesis protein CcdA [Spirochaetales bacterium]|uniref:Cytochrome c biogenesis protein CcdA n=1 Tax=Candidatus Thalassospirochaeta sargassi TaxID=3119039 RepID=A0AAJ1ICZ2_9SPIO|nr:cytochrome c biogenesis protein CcdA [Spirochaetales bacterium]